MSPGVAGRTVTLGITPACLRNLWPVIYRAEAFDFIGGRTRTRTLDPLIKSELLCGVTFSQTEPQIWKS